ncbi:MAG: DoxX family protein [Planctomycetota bacterium]|nr:DoxX family protein [Planctomycetota bacterium]
MSSEINQAAISPARLWTGRVLSWLPAAMLLASAAMNLVKPEDIVKQTVAMGYSEEVMVPLGIVLLISVLLYLYPRTAVLGAILLTGYLGGAVNTHVHHGDGIGQILLPAVVGAVLWLGLVLRDNRLLALVPWRSE